MGQRNRTTASGSTQKTTSNKKRNSATSDTILDTLNDTIETYYPEEKDNKFHGYLRGRFQDEVWYFENLEDNNSRFYAVLKIALVVLSALTSLFVGIEAIYSTSTVLKIIALVLALFVTVFSTILTTFNFQEKSITFRQYRESLITEFYKFHERIPPYNQDKDGALESTFMAKIEKIIEDANKGRDGLPEPEKPENNP